MDSSNVSQNICSSRCSRRTATRHLAALEPIKLQRSVRVQLERICRIDHDSAFEQFVVLGDECGERVEPDREHDRISIGNRLTHRRGPRKWAKLVYHAAA